MTNDDKSTDKALEFEDSNFEDVHISDDDLISDDKNFKSAKKKAKKLVRSQLSDSDLKKLKRKKLLIVSAIALLIILLPLMIPFTRWPILNALGVRSTITITVLEKDDKIPISNASIWLDETFFTSTDEFGSGTFENTKLGPHNVRIQKNGYSREDIQVVTGLTETKNTIEVKAIGIKVNLDVRNWLTGEPIVGAVVGVNKDTVKSDKTGRASIVIPPDDDRKVKLSVGATGYISQLVKPSYTSDSKEVALVSDAKNYFISKRDGKYDIFSSNIDGSSQQKIIEATGKEDPSFIQFSIHRGNRFGVLVANREGKVINNRVVAGIYIIDFASSNLKKIDEGSDVRLLDWGDDTVVYQKSDANLNYDDPAFSKISSYNVGNAKQKQLAQANYFSVAIVAQNFVYFAGADGYRDEANTPLTSVELSSGATKTILQGRIPSGLTRSNYESLTLLADDSNYYNVTVKGGTVKQIDRRVDSSLNFGLNPNGGQVVYAEQVDGQGALMVRSTGNDDKRVVTKLSGLKSPTRWVTDRLVVVRVVTTTQTADYLVDVPTGKSAKVVDVSDIRFVGDNY
ncbi:carboxypeptidase regulatory-like domain-containing protein [Candidatus Nomurabacteria bacterium]|nr:carboxypeptidase regulatory-like domain-containing protein [Candidatus Nomurabacteria bacterium]